MADRIKIGVMGCANIAERMVIPAILLSTDYELTLVSSREEAKAARYAEKFGCGYVVGYDALIESDEVEVIYMPLPTGLHLEWAIKALEAGKHLLLEKSLATNLSEAQKIVDHARINRRLIQENFMFAHHRQLGVIKELLASQRIGNLRCIRSSFGFPPFPDPTNIRYSRELGGGALLDAGAYTLKVAQILLGNQIEVHSSVLTYDESKGVDLYGGIFLSDSNGVVVETAFGFDQFYQCNLEIWGSKGKITAERIFTAGPGVVPKIRMEEAGTSETFEIEPDNHFLNLLTHFAGTLRSGEYSAGYLEVLSQARLLQTARDKALTFSSC